MVENGGVDAGQPLKGYRERLSPLATLCHTVNILPEGLVEFQVSIQSHCSSNFLTITGTFFSKHILGLPRPTFKVCAVLP